MIDPIGTERLPLFDTPAPHFDGVSYEPEHDSERLSGLLGRVYHTLTSGQWYTLSALVEACGGSEAGVSARLRDLRKRRFGGHTIQRQRVGDPSAGLWAYRLERGAR